MQNKPFYGHNFAIAVLGIPTELHDSAKLAGCVQEAGRCLKIVEICIKIWHDELNQFLIIYPEGGTDGDPLESSLFVVTVAAAVTHKAYSVWIFARGT